MAIGNGDIMENLWQDIRYGMRMLVKAPSISDWRSQNHAFDHLSAFHTTDFIMTGRGKLTRLQGAVISAIRSACSVPHRSWVARFPRGRMNPVIRAELLS